MPRFDSPHFQKLMALAQAGSSAPEDEPERAPSAAAEAEARKQRSIAILASEGVPINEHLPTIEAEAEVPRRSTEEVALRSIALMVVAAKATTRDQEQTRRRIATYRLHDAFTPNERAFIEHPQPAPRDCTQLSWRIECAWVMLWALGFVGALGRPDKQVEPSVVIDSLKARGRDRFAAEARLRPTGELLDAADLLYRYHWAVRDAELNGLAPPANLEAGVVLEWHYALNWLIGYRDAEWDDVTTDT